MRERARRAAHNLAAFIIPRRGSMDLARARSSANLSLITAHCVIADVTIIIIVLSSP